MTAVTVNRAPSGTDQYAHVHFRRAADAATAKFELDGVSWPGMTGGSRALKIQYSDSRSSGRASSRTDGSGAGTVVATCGRPGTAGGSGVEGWHAARCALPVCRKNAGVGASGCAASRWLQGLVDTVRLECAPPCHA